MAWRGGGQKQPRPCSWLQKQQQPQQPQLQPQQLPQPLLQLRSSLLAFLKSTPPWQPDRTSSPCSLTSVTTATRLQAILPSPLQLPSLLLRLCQLWLLQPSPPPSTLHPLRSRRRSSFQLSNV